MHSYSSKESEYNGAIRHDLGVTLTSLSKAGRYFTVGASGLLVNYLVSFLLANVCQTKLSVNLLLLLEVELFHSRLAETGRCFCLYYLL